MIDISPPNIFLTLLLPAKYQQNCEATVEVRGRILSIIIPDQCLPNSCLVLPMLWKSELNLPPLPINI